jgi:hypothetical protein
MNRKQLLIDNFTKLYNKTQSQFIIDPDGNIHYLIDLDFYKCVFYEVDSTYYEICKYIEIYSDDPEYELKIKGWIFVDMFKHDAIIKNKPTKKQCITLNSLGFNEVVSDDNLVYKFKLK